MTARAARLPGLTSQIFLGLIIGGAPPQRKLSLRRVAEGRSVLGLPARGRWRIAYAWLTRRTRSRVPDMKRC